MVAAKVKSILVVEDEAPLAKALSLKLEKSGFAVVVANDGEAALEQVSKQSFDLIVLDLIMPKKDGFEVLQALKEKKVKTPVIVCSNLSQTEDDKKVKSLGAVDFFIKSDMPLVEIVKKIERFTQ